MHHGIRRFLIVGGIFAATFFLYSLWGSQQEGYGLWNLVRGERSPEPEVYTPTPLPKLSRDDVPGLARLNEEADRLVESVRESVVSIHTKTLVDKRDVVVTPFGSYTLKRREDLAGLGSGAIVSPEGHVITNHHVIKGVDEIQITAHDGSNSLATLIGKDEDMDIAVLKIESARPREFPSLAFGDSDEARVGHTVFAIGSPFDLKESVTSGIISAREREVSDSSAPSLQTQAPINQGNSGGPLVNIYGEIIGINRSIRGQQGLNIWHGISFAIPSNNAREAFERIMSEGRTEVSYLGVVAENVAAVRESKFGYKRSTKVLVKDVHAGSPGAKAGLLPGDMVETFDGRPVSDMSDLIKRVKSYPIGQPLEIVVYRKGETLTLTATTVARSKYKAENRKQTLSDVLGVKVKDLDIFERRNLAILEDSPGVVVESVAKESSFFDEFRRGDMIDRVNDTLIMSSVQFEEVINALPMGEEAVIRYKRGGREYLTAPFTPKS